MRYNFNINKVASMDNNPQPANTTPTNKPSVNPQPTEIVNPDIKVPQPVSYNSAQKKPLNKGVVIFLRFLIIAGGLFVFFVIGLGITFSACFTIKGPPPPHCGPLSFVSLILMPGSSLLFLIPLARKIK